MTTATEPPLIDGPSIGVDDMPALDQPDERVCEISDPDDRECGRPAAWLVSARCVDATEVSLMCDPCRRRYLDEGEGLECTRCGADAVITWMEPL